MNHELCFNSKIQNKGTIFYTSRRKQNYVTVHCYSLKKDILMTSVVPSSKMLFPIISSRAVIHMDLLLMRPQFLMCPKCPNYGYNVRFK